VASHRGLSDIPKYGLSGLRLMTYKTSVAGLLLCNFVAATMLHHATTPNATATKNAPSDTDDNVIVGRMLLVATIVQEQKRKKQKLGKEVSGVTREWIEQHIRYKTWCLLQPSLQNLKLHATEQASYRNFLCMGALTQNCSKLYWTKYHRSSHGNTQ